MNTKNSALVVYERGSLRCGGTEIARDPLQAAVWDDAVCAMLLKRATADPEREAFVAGLRAQGLTFAVIEQRRTEHLMRVLPKATS